MEPMSSSTFNTRSWSVARSLLISGIGSVLLASCSNLGYSSDASSPQSEAYTSDPEALAAEFSFPQATCGEQATQPSGTWYVVYIDGGNPDEVRREYCRDAIGTVRDKTGAPTVQVASLTDYSKALKLATAVGGEVETTVGQANQSPGATASPAASPASPASPTATTSSSTAYLTAADPGSSINIRESTSTSAPIKQTGRTGDQVRIVEQQPGDDGRTWYKIALQSGQEGWVRSDFVTREMANASSAGTNSTAAGTMTTGSGTTGPGATGSTGTTNSSGTTSGTQPAPSNGSYASSSSSSSPSTSSSYTTPDRTSQYSTASSAPEPDTSNRAEEEQSEYSSEYSSNDDEPSEASGITGDSAMLVSDNPQSRINVRDDASTSAPVQHIGYAGDPIHILDTADGEDGYTWYQVEFESGAVGWVRGDLVGGG